MATIKNNAVIVDACSRRIHALKKYVTPKTERLEGTVVQAAPAASSNGASH